jgi:urea transport system permease protein
VFLVQPKRRAKRRGFFRLAILLGLFCLPVGVWAAGTAEIESTELRAVEEVFAGNIAGIVQSLNTGDFETRLSSAQRLGDSSDPLAVKVLTQLLNGNLYERRSDKLIVLAIKTDDGFQLLETLTEADLGSVGRRDVRKVKLNNKLRTRLREMIASKRLFSDDTQTRLTAIKEMMASMDESSGELVSKALDVEVDDDVRVQLQTALALLDLDGENRTKRLAAIDLLQHNLSTPVRSRLSALAEDEALDAETRDKAAKAFRNIELTLENYRLIETVFFGLSLGSVLVLAAIGLAITFGVMGIINMAHGELIMLGAYTAYVVQQIMPDHIGLSILVSIPMAFLVAGSVGIAIERGVIRFLHGRPLETLLATFGISLVLQQAVRSIFSPLNRSVSTPDWMSGSFEVVQGLSFTYNRLYILLFSLMVFFVLLVVLQRSRLGLEVRAVAQNRNMARAMGVRSNWVDALTFGLGSGIAGVAGVALSQLTNVGPNLGQGYIVDSFMVVVFGGVGNIWGTLVAGLSLGVANKFLEPWVGAVMAKIVVLVFIILFIQKRPSGLFPQKGRAAEG